MAPRPRHRHQTASPVYLLPSPRAAAAASTVYLLPSPRAAAAKLEKRKWNSILVTLASTAFVSSVIFTWKLTASLQDLQQKNDMLSVIPPAPPREPLRFISVVGMHHTGTKAMWNSIRSNEGVASEKGIDLKAYAMSDDGGYPPCGVPLKSDSSVDMSIAMGNATRIDDPNTHLFANYGTMWGDWAEGGPHTLEAVLKMKPPHKQDVFYTWWKHTPPQHPILACFRPDTLYVVMVRHPRAWKQSLDRSLYDFRYEPLLKLWRLIRSNPRQLPPLELRFRSLYNAWEYWIRGYLSWEILSAGKNCYADSGESRNNCLAGSNKISKDKRNILIVRYEDYLMSPKKVLAQIFSFATRGLINAKTEEDKFVPHDLKNLEIMKELLINNKEHDFFSAKMEDWDGANLLTELPKLCALLGYGCENNNLFIE